MKRRNHLPALHFIFYSITVCHLQYILCQIVEKDIVFAVLGQDNPYHDERANLFIQHLLQQPHQPEDFEIDVIHNKWPFVGAWSIFPLFSQVINEYKTIQWLFVCEEETRIKFDMLQKLLKNFDPTEEYFLGKAIYDNQAVIIHHFSNADDPDGFPYPDLAAGVLFSRALVQKLADRWNKKKKLPTDFTIDVKHELAMWIADGGKGVSLTGLKTLCTNNIRDECTTTYPTPFPQCGEAVDDKDIYVAVKTCSKFHDNRLVVVRNTWARESDSVRYFSDLRDESIPIISLGVPNTEKGHCRKTLEILDYYEQTSKAPWLIIVDDDTIISLKRLRALLACYNPRIPMALGERYGYNVVGGLGYDYPTGGAGMIFSRVAVTQLLTGCNCPMNDSPDDMILGLCLRHHKIPIIHSRHLHQARPDDYSPDFLAHTTPVSFHKHWNNDPYLVYMEWFGNETLPTIHEEL